MSPRRVAEFAVWKCEERWFAHNPSDRALMGRLTDQIAKQIEQVRPDVVVTWGPDGGTGHPDHRIVSNIATQLQRFGAPGDLEAAKKALACHSSQFTPEMLQKLNPELGRIWNGKVAFVPALASMSGNDLFR